MVSKIRKRRFWNNKYGFNFCFPSPSTLYTHILYLSQCLLPPGTRRLTSVHSKWGLSTLHCEEYARFHIRAHTAFRCLFKIELQQGCQWKISTARQEWEQLNKITNFGIIKSLSGTNAFVLINCEITVIVLMNNGTKRTVKYQSSFPWSWAEIF